MEKKIQLNRMPEPTWSWLRVNQQSWTPSQLVVDERAEGETSDAPSVRDAAPETVLAAARALGLEASYEQAPLLAVFEAEESLHSEFLGELRPVFEQARTLKLRLPAGRRAEGRLELSGLLGSLRGAAAVDRVELTLEAGSELACTLACRKELGESYLGLIDLVLEANARLEWMDAQLLSPEAESSRLLRAWVGERAELKVYTAEIGAKRLSSTYKVLLQGEESRLVLKLLYVGEGEQQLDMTSFVQHLGRASEALVVARGVLNGRSKKIFRDTLDFKTGAVQSKGREEESVLMLSPTVRNISVPLLYCGESDVEGEHAASSGKPEQSLLYYMMSRGISELEARKLLAEASFASVLSEISDRALAEEILGAVHSLIE